MSLYLLKRSVLTALCLMLAFVCSIQLAHAKSWADAIADVETMANNFWQTSREKGFTEPLGTAFNERDVQMHLCAILGRMVGHADAITHLEPPQPGPEASGRDFAIAATSLGNWVIAARYHSSLSDNQKRRLWNLDCIGKQGIPRSLLVEAPLGHNVIYDSDRRAIIIQGDITPGFAAAVENAIKRYSDARYVSLGSGGGAVYEAIRAGVAIRQAGLQTELINACYSACPLALAGGTTRFMWWPYEDVGLHQVSRYGVAVPLNDPVYRDIAQYLHLMGVDAVLVLKNMHSEGPSGMRNLTEEERCATRLITNHQRGCLAQ